MKMTKFFAMALAVGVGALLAGCSDAAVEEESIAPAATTGTITATIEKDADDTRANLLQIDETYYRNHWEAGDEVSMFPYGNDNRVGTLTSGAGSSVGVFKWTTLGNDMLGDTHYGVFPYNAKDHVDNTTKMIHTELPVEQTYNEGSYGGQNVYMTAYSEVDADGGYTLNYQYYHGAIGIQLYGDAVVDKIRVTVTGVRNIAGEVHIPTPYIPTPGYPQAKTPTTAVDAKTVTFNCGTHGNLAGTTASAPRLFSIALLPGTINNLKVEALDAAGNVLLTKTATNKNIKIQRNVIKRMTAFEVKKPAPAVVDLSANGTYANCYIVTKAGAYKFATRSVDGSIISGNYRVVDWVWKTTGVELTDITYKNGYIYFTVENFVKGNASIGAYDNTINPKHFLHNWHIWLTDQPEEETSVMGKAYMDRNLGAITTDVGDTDSYGLLYQWGRKDPLNNRFGSSVNGLPTINSDKWNSVTGTTWFSSWKAVNGYCSDENGDINDYPTVFMYADLGVNVYNYQWNWDLYRFWGETKTNYDPCPYGYIVPSYDDLSAEDWTYEGNLCGIVLTGGNSYTPIPRQGYVNRTGSITQGYNAIWSSTILANNQNVYGGISIRYEDTNSGVYPNWSDCTQAYPVRCVKE